MRYILTLFLLLIGLASFSQTDSTIIRFSNVNDEDLQEMIDLLGIQFINVVCDDTLMLGKKFFISTSEYRDGIVVSQDTSHSKCIEEILTIQMGDKVVNMIVHLCDKITFTHQDLQYKIKMIGIMNDNNFKLNIRHPGLRYTLLFNGDNDYLLKAVNSCTNSNKMTVPINKKIPILTYAPPVKAISGGLSSYCIQGEEDVENWFDTFKMRHYYVIYLKIQ